MLWILRDGIIFMKTTKVALPWIAVRNGEHHYNMACLQSVDHPSHAHDRTVEVEADDTGDVRIVRIVEGTDGYCNNIRILKDGQRAAREGGSIKRQ